VSTVALCVRCGTKRADYREICPSCGHRPEGEGLLVAWLLSDEGLPPDQLADAAERLKRGEAIRPSERMLERARMALGTHLASDPGLSVGERVALLLCSVLVTPLPGLVLWAWWRRDRPRAALQALGLSLPMAIAFGAFVIWRALG
jgi:hypothetical protein